MFLFFDGKYKICQQRRKNVFVKVAHYKKSDGKRATKSYARVIMENKLGRELRPDERVYHIDRDPSNDDISNLEIKVTKKYKSKVSTCTWCNCQFVNTPEHQKNSERCRKRPGRLRPYRGPFCSWRCVSEYGSLCCGWF